MSAVQVNGLAEVRKAFRDLEGKAGPKRLRQAYVQVARTVSVRAQAAARAGSPLQAKMAGAILPAATAKAARLRISTSKRNPAAGIAFWGTDRRIGWFAQPKYGNYSAKDQHLPAWVGSSWGAAWSAGNFTEGPYAIRTAVGASVPDIERTFLTAILDAARDVGFSVH